MKCAGSGRIRLRAGGGWPIEMPRKDLKNILGLRFGARVATGYVGKKKWKSLCDCGKEFIVDGADLRRRIYICDHVAVDRFFAKVDKSGDCWFWTGSLSADGYGQFRADKVVLSHIFSWRIKNGDVPKGKELDHLCRNRSCVNPDHLEPVTHAENVRRGMLGETTRKRFENNRLKLK